jgi:hypothetical protein
VAEDCSTEQNHIDSPLLRLPAELKNKIYAYACDHIEIIYTLKNPPHKDSEYCKLHMKRDGHTLLSVCRQVRHEVLPYAKSYQHLTCDTTLYGLTCADDSADENRYRVEHIEVTGTGVPKALVVSLIKKIRMTFPYLTSIQAEGLAQDRESIMQEKDSIFRGLGLGAGTSGPEGGMVWSSRK